MDVVDNWRAAHAYPLNTFQITLRNRARRIDRYPLVAQRRKRVRSIREKLIRYPWLKLSQMQDIAGCRAILSSVENVYELVSMYKRGYSQHVLVSENDYIRKPKADGYRSYHLIYRYGDAKHPDFQDRQIEMQIRSQMQHCWATAVETVDIFLRQGLKAHRGDPKWRRFFALSGSAIALAERCRVAPRTPKQETEIRDELYALAEELEVKARLHAFGDTLNVVGEADTRRRRIRYIILALDMSTVPPTMTLYGYPPGRVPRAESDLARLEDEGKDAVLVSVSDTTNLRAAYPNYYFDTRFFVSWVEQFLGAELLTTAR